MAIYEAPKDNSYTPKGTYGDSLHSGLQQLANAKLGQIHQRHQQTQNFNALKSLGYSPQDAQALVHVPLETILKHAEANPQGQQQPPDLAQQSAIRQQQAQPQQQRSQIPVVGPNNVPKLHSFTPAQYQKYLQTKPWAQQQAQAPVQGQPQGKAVIQGPPQAQQVQPQPEPQAIQPGVVSKTTAKAKREETKELRKQAHEFAKIEEKRKNELSKEDRKRDHSLEKHEMTGYEKALDDRNVGRETKKNVDRLITLINKGDVVNPTEDHLYRYAAKIFQIPTKDLRGADTAEFEKITAGFIKNAKEWFGGRVTNFDLESFLKTLPTLNMDHESKLRLLGSMKAAAEAQEIRANAYEELRKANGGRLPAYAKAEVEKMIAPRLDELAEQFVDGSLNPQLSEAGKKGGERLWWARYAKGAATAANPLNLLGGIAGGIESAMPSLGTAAGAAAKALL